MVMITVKDKLVFLHLHTSGFGKSQFGIVADYQPISVALNITDIALKPIAKFHKLINFNENYVWDDKAAKIHGFDKTILKKFGNELNEVSDNILTFLSNHFDLVNDRIQFAGFNIGGFHYPFFLNLIDPMNKGINLKYRLYDIDFMLIMDGIHTNKELFNMMGKTGCLTSSEINSVYIEYIRSKQDK